MALDTSTAARVGPDHRRSRPVLDAALAVVAVAWLATLVVVVVRRGDHAAEAPATAEVSPPTDLPTAGEILDQLEVETGFTPGAEVGGAGRETVAYAIVVENTSDFAVRDLQLVYRFVGPSGAAVRGVTRSDDGVPDAEHASIAEIPAGERSAVSGTFYLDNRSDLVSRSSDVVEIEVDLDAVGDWLPADYHQHTAEARSYAGDLEATGIEVGYGTLNEPVVTFTVESGRNEPAETSLYAYVVFRDDTDGAIVGGTYGELGDDGFVRIPAGGSVGAEVGGPMEIPGIDPSQTEVYLSIRYVI